MTTPSPLPTVTVDTSVVVESVTETSVTLQVQLTGLATEPIISIFVEIFNERMELVTLSNRTGGFLRGGMVEVTVTGLNTGTQYRAVAYGVNAGGVGPKSDPMTFNTGE